MATTTPNYGWPVPTSTDYVKDGATAIEALGDAIDATVFGLPSGALTLISDTTIGSAVASVTVSGAFSATYENYKIFISGGASSAGNSYLNFKLGAASTGFYNNFNYSGFTSGALASIGINNAAQWGYVGSADTAGLNACIELTSPFLSKRTMFTAPQYFNGDAGTSVGYLNDSNSYTAFTITPSSGTLTGGKIYVYGYGI
jgi:hypothetical protein